MGCLGDLRYRAPEVVMNKPYSFKADCWTFGIVLFFLMTKRHPFDAEGAESPVPYDELEEEEIQAIE